MSLFSKLSYLVAGLLVGFLLIASLKARAEGQKVLVLVAAFALPTGETGYGVRKDKLGYPVIFEDMAACEKQRAADLPLVEEAAAAFSAHQWALECIEVDRAVLLKQLGIVSA